MTKKRHMKLVAIAAFAVLLSGKALPQNSDDELTKRVGKIDKKFHKALADLAETFDKEKDQETAHFLAECFVGLQGAKKSTTVTAIRAGCELDLYLGKEKGAKPLKKGRRITQKMAPLGKKYRAVVDELVKKAKNDGWSLEQGEKAVLYDCIIKSEIGENALEYVEALKEFNRLRLGMKLRAVLWDFENSRRLILGAWYMAETGYVHKDKPDEGTPEEAIKPKEQVQFFWTDHVRWTRENSNRGLNRVAGEPMSARRSVGVRESLLNPDARRLFLGHWRGTYDFQDMPVCAYDIPRTFKYRADIPTPSERYSGTSVDSRWVDMEEVAKLRDKTCPFVRYPFVNEEDVPISRRSELKWDYGVLGWPEDEMGEGLATMLRVFGDVEITGESASLKDQKGNDVPFYLLRETTKGVPLHPIPTIVVLPKKKLKPSTTYTVTIQCKLDGTPFEKSWSFKTAKK